MYIVRFIRRDSLPNEEYYYQDVNVAMEHLNVFYGDDSDLYERIEVISLESETKKEKVISYLKF